MKVTEPNLMVLVQKAQACVGMPKFGIAESAPVGLGRLAGPQKHASLKTGYHAEFGRQLP